MPKWAVKVPFEALDDSKQYFLTLRGVHFLSRDMKGRVCWTVKPGIAVKLYGNEMRKVLLKDFGPDDPENANYFPVEVPKDAATRWRRRKPVRKF